jgi:hypothetical protein
MITFSSQEQIDLRDIKDHTYLLAFILGLLKNHIQQLECEDKELKSKFEVSYQNGGAGSDWVEVYHVNNPKACIVFGFADKFLGCDVFSDCEIGDTLENTCLDSVVPTINGIDTFIMMIVKKYITKEQIIFMA